MGTWPWSLLGPCGGPMDPPPDRLRVRGEPVEAGPAGWKEPCLGGTDGQNKLAKRFKTEIPGNDITLTFHSIK